MQDEAPMLYWYCPAARVVLMIPDARLLWLKLLSCHEFVAQL